MSSVIDRPDTLLVDLRAVTHLNGSGVVALTAGSAAAIDYGTLYRVINARDQVRQNDARPRRLRRAIQQR